MWLIRVIPQRALCPATPATYTYHTQDLHGHLTPFFYQAESRNSSKSGPGAHEALGTANLKLNTSE